MAQDFDPYRDLLNIRTTERPPDHYALLGLSLFESDATKIDAAAGERMQLLQELANSEHMDVSQRLLNEVSGARRLLLNATRKIAYDEELRARQKRSVATSTSKRGARGSGKSGSEKRMLPVGVAAAIAVIAAIAFLLTRGNTSGSGNVVVDWPLSERQSAAVLVDGSPITITESQPLYLNLKPGRHQLKFQRTGYKDIPKTLNISKGTVHMKLSWVAEE